MKQNIKLLEARELLRNFHLNIKCLWTLNLFDYYFIGYHLFCTCVNQIHAYTTQTTYKSCIFYVTLFEE
jgi:hypothetical protein